MLTDRGHSLDRPASLRRGAREDAPSIGTASSRRTYIDYNRRDVEATAALAFKLLEEYDRFDVDLQETQAYSPASLGKAHLRKMGIAPILERQPISRSGISAMRSRPSSAGVPAPISAKFRFPSSIRTFSQCIRRSTR